MSVVWSILAIIIAAVVCYFIYQEYIIEHPEESDAEKDIEADLTALASEAGMSEFDSLPDHRLADTHPSIETGGAAVIGVADAADDQVSADAEPVASAAPAVVAKAADEAVEADVVDAVTADADEVVDETVADVSVVAAEESAGIEETVEEDVAVEQGGVRAVEIPFEVDDLTKIKGIGKVYAQRLNEAGITSYQQIIDADVDTLEAVSKAIPAANAYDWARQARKLSES